MSIDQSVGLRIADRLKKLRKVRRLTLQDVADRAGTSKSRIWEVERGRSINPTIDLAVKLSRALGCSLDYLTGLTSDQPDLHPEALRIANEVDALLRARLSQGEDA